MRCSPRDISSAEVSKPLRKEVVLMAGSQAGRRERDFRKERGGNGPFLMLLRFSGLPYIQALLVCPTFYFLGSCIDDRVYQTPGHLHFCFFRFAIPPHWVVARI